MEQRSIAFIGAGNMARSIIAGLVASGYAPDKITATAPSSARREPLARDYGIHTTDNNLSAASDADVIVLAVKPQLMEEVCRPLQILDFSGKLVISIAAGIGAERLNEMLATNLNLVRVMPNTPSLIGKGMSGLYASNSLNPNDRQFAETLMQTVGQVCWAEQDLTVLLAVGVTACCGNNTVNASLLCWVDALARSCTIQQVLLPQQESGTRNALARA